MCKYILINHDLQVNEGVRSQENTDRLEWLQTHVNLESIGEVGIFRRSNVFAVFSNVMEPKGHREACRNPIPHGKCDNSKKHGKNFKQNIFNTHLYCARLSIGYIASDETEMYVNVFFPSFFYAAIGF